MVKKLMLFDLRGITQYMVWFEISNQCKDMLLIYEIIIAISHNPGNLRWSTYRGKFESKLLCTNKTYN